MIEILLSQFDQLLASVLGVIVVASGCWFTRRWLQLHPHTSRSYAYSESPAITAAAQAKVNCWFEAEQLLGEIRDLLDLLQTQPVPAKREADFGQAKQTVQRMYSWIARQKLMIAALGEQDTAAAIKQRAAEDEMVLQWLKDHPGERLQPHGENLNSHKHPHEAQHQEKLHSKAHHSTTPHCQAPPELELSQIASELLPFNPVAVRLIGKRANADMSAAVERIENLLASVDPPASLGTMLTALEPVTAIRDPNGRQSMRPEELQRRRSDQAIIYDTMLRRCLGDDDFAWRMLHKFPTRCRTELDSVATEIRRRAWTSATRRITQLRGMAANIAAENLRDALANLENVCRQQSATRADQLLEGVRDEFKQVLDFIARADGVCPLPGRREEEQRPLSHWPAELMDDSEQYLTLDLERLPT